MPRRDLIIRPGGDQLTIAPPEPPIIIPPPDPTPTPGTRSPYRKGFFMAALDTSLFGTYVWPDAEIAETRGNEWIKTGGLIDQAYAGNGGTRTAGAPGINPKTRLIMKVTPTNTAKNPDGTWKLKNDTDLTFSETKWATQFDIWYNALGAAGIAKVRQAVADGVIAWVYLLDDFFGTGGPNSFSAPCTYEQADFMGHHVKVTRNMPWLACAMRGPNTALKTMAKTTVAGKTVYRKYKYVDAGWHDSRLDRDGPAGAFYDLNITAGKAVNLGAIGGLNVLNGGTGSDPAWRQHPNLANLFGMSPAEIRTSGKACMDRADLVSCYVWSWGIGGHGASGDAALYLADPSIASALADVFTYGIGKTDGLINIRGDLVAA